MARIRKVTRTIASTECEVMTVNTKTQEVSSVVIMVSGTYDTEDEKEKKALDKAVKKSFANQKLGDDVVMVSVTSATPITMHYSMLEDDFIKLAESTILEIDGEKVENEEDTEDDDEE